jgi:UDP-GlcNAc:undecaprenyl-phosphate GlcNAc-1-phosphate transferase
MRFPFNAYLLAVLSACGTTFLTLPLWRRWSLRTGLVDEPGERKIHHQPTPLVGGLAVMTGLVLPMLAAWLYLGWHSRRASSVSPAGLVDSTAAFLLNWGFGRRAGELAGIFTGAFGILLLGWLDDKHELRPAGKFVGQFLVAALVAASGARITLFVHSPAFHYTVTILWILTLVNAFNFMDNMNGLCGGLGAIAAWCFALLAAAGGQYLVALIAFLAFGALVGFLPYNFPRARVFLGDAGSHLIGYLMAVLAILPHFYTARNPRRFAVLIPLAVLAVPLGDLVWVVLLRWRLGKPFYLGDTNHLSHRLVRRGLSPTRAVLVIWLLAALCGLVCLF